MFGSILHAWGQPQDVCRLGMFHSVYSNSFVAMGVLDPCSDRRALQALIGQKAEDLVYKFCSIDRDDFVRPLASSCKLICGPCRSRGC